MPEKQNQKRRSFSDEFRRDAVNLVVSQGYSFAAASKAVNMEREIQKKATAYFAKESL